MYTFDILNIIMNHSNYSIQDLIKTTFIPPATVYRIINTLENQKLICKSKNYSSKNNKKITSKYSTIKITVTKNGIHILAF